MIATTTPLSQSRVRFVLGAIASVIILTIYHQKNAIQQWHITSQTYPGTSLPSTEPIQARLLKSIIDTSDYFIDFPLPPSDFGKMGKRLQVLRDWIEASDDPRTNADLSSFLRQRIDTTALSLFPFLQDPRQQVETSLCHVRQRFEPRGKGIVITAGKNHFRYACHLIKNIRETLGSQLPIEIVYAGEDDLPVSYREFITNLATDVTTLDITQVFDDIDLKLAEGGWAIKPFAALASRFEQVILLDADVVFLQSPDVIFDNHSGYRDTGSLLFHDRLLWQGAFKERHAWWEAQLAHQPPSSALSKSRVYNEGFAEECDAGLVVLDKGRLPVLMGLLHTCWQNTRAVRDNWTYKMGYGDKESWWFGLELSGAEYAFEGHYGSMLGHVKVDEQHNDDVETGTNRVCSFTIAHVDEHNKLLWYNGSLLKNKALNSTEYDLPVPTHHMMDGVWEKGATKPDVSCMRDGPFLQETTDAERSVVRRSVEGAREVDVLLGGVM